VLAPSVRFVRRPVASKANASAGPEAGVCPIVRPAASIEKVPSGVAVTFPAASCVQPVEFTRFVHPRQFNGEVTIRGVAAFMRLDVLPALD
jgi:hypothetical protein